MTACSHTSPHSGDSASEACKNPDIRKITYELIESGYLYSEARQPEAFELLGKWVTVGQFRKDLDGSFFNDVDLNGLTWASYQVVSFSRKNETGAHFEITTVLAGS